MPEPVPARAVSRVLVERAAVQAIDELRREPLTVAFLAACGATPCHLVGGAVRDRVLGLVTHDLDAVVAGRGREIASALAASLPARLVLLGGKEFAAYRLVTPAGEVLDLWDREAMSLADDLARRDFTVNAIAVEPRTGAIVDPFGGLADLARRTLRAVTAESFRGDPLRVLRLVRFELQLPGFSVEPATLDLARAAAPRLPEMAAERIREELRLIFSHPAAKRGLLGLAVLGAFPALWLEESTAAPGAALDSLAFEARAAPGFLPPEAGEGEASRSAVTLAAAELATLPACAARLELWLSAAGTGIEIDGENGAHQAGAWEMPDLLAARLAATCRYIGPHPTVATRSAGAPAAGRQGHGDAPALAAGRRPGAAAASLDGQAALDRLEHAGYVTARQAAEIRPLLAPSLALPPAGGGVERVIERRRYLHRHGRRWLTAACAAGGAATVRGRADRERWRRGARALCELARREGEALIAPPRLLGGDEVQRLLGIPAGPAVGRAIAALKAAQVDGAVRTRDEAERYLMRSRAAVPAPAPHAAGRDDSTTASDDEVKGEGAGAKTGGKRGAGRPRALSGRRRPPRPSGAG